MEKVLLGDSAKRKKILVVEDNEDFRVAIKEILKLNDYQVVTAVNGVDAIESAEKEHPDLILMDIGLPGKNGIEITKAIKSLCPPAKYIFLTNYDDPEYRQAADKLGVDCFLSKRRAKRAEIIDCLMSILNNETNSRRQSSPCRR